MQQNIKILIIEDNPILADKIRAYFDEYVDTGVTQNLEQALRKTRDWEPDLIIIDVDLEHRNGYEVCDVLKQDSKAGEIPVIFYSENDSLRERMLGYEVGAVDYFHKQSETKEVQAKMQAIARQAQKTQALKEHVVTAEKTAMEALSTSSELGKAVRFVEKSYDVGELEVLAQLLIEFCQEMGLSAVIMFVVRSGNYFYSTSHNNVSPIEQELVQKLHISSSERYVDFGCRTLTNFPQVALLVKNMPIDDRSRYGRVKDAFPFILGATDAKVKMIDAEGALTAHCASLTSSIEAAQLTLDGVEEDFRRSLVIVESIMGELSSTMELDIQGMNMDEKDEEQIIRLVEGASRKLNIILRENALTDTVLKDLVKLLGKLTREQGQIIVDTLSKKHDASLDYSPDIEIF